MKTLFKFITAVTCIAAAMALSSCGFVSALSAGPSAAADATTIDERGGIAIETVYTGAVTAGTFAFRAGIIAPSADPEVQFDNFCDLVFADAYAASDKGGRISALECELRQLRDLGRAAYDAGNASDYNTALNKAVPIADAIIDIVKGDDP